MALSSTFSESWHLVASSRVTLRSQVRVHRQRFQGEKWYVLFHPYTHGFFRLRPAAYAFTARLQPGRTVESVWRQCLALDPDGAPGQAEVLQLLAQLHAADLIVSDSPADAGALAERLEKRQSRERTAWWLNLLFARFPLLHPDPFFRRALPLVGWVFSWPGAFLWLAVVLSGIKTVIDHAGALAAPSQGILAPANLPWLYLCLAGLSLLHECGHGFACRRYGGQVTTMGVLLMVFTPLPYVDVSSSWSFRRRRERLLVGAAGILTELLVAALAVQVWAHTAPGLVHSLAFNLMFLASVSTLLFNANPLLRFDGYYLLSDGLGLPNLASRAQDQLRYLVQKHLLRLPRVRPAAATPDEARWLVVYGAASAVYRVFLLGSILLFVAGQYLLLGLILAAAALLSWVLIPCVKAVHFLLASPLLERGRAGALFRCALAAAIPLLPCVLLPLPTSFTAPGVVVSSDYLAVTTGSSGRLSTILTAPGTAVTPGTPLLLLDNPLLALELQAAQARVSEAGARRRAAFDQGGGYLATLESYLAAARDRAGSLERDLAALRLTAPASGLWHAPGLELQLGRHFPRGATLGEIIGSGPFEISAAVSQRDAARLFSGSIRRVQARVNGHAWTTLDTVGSQLVPGRQEVFPSLTLSWTGGGPLAPDPSDPSGLTAAEPFFLVRAFLPHPAPVPLRHGQSALVRFALPPEPLFAQWSLRLRQLIQERFQR